MCSALFASAKKPPVGRLQAPLKLEVTKLIDFGTLKYKERDELSDVIVGWAKKHPFDIETLRDQRLRGSPTSKVVLKLWLGISTFCSLISF